MKELGSVGREEFFRTFNVERFRDINTIEVLGVSEPDKIAMNAVLYNMIMGTDHEPGLLDKLNLKD